MFYPLLFKPVYKEMVWGGNRLHTRYGRLTPYEKTGESWDITCRPREMGVIENGPDTGSTLAELIARDASGLLGTRLATVERFPLLIKIIDADENLSVQVHPDDAYAAAHTDHESGKNEMWYVMEAPADGHLIIGLQNGVTRERMAAALEMGEAEKYLCRLPVKAGDVIHIPAGLVHALTKGVMVAEVQQNADVTYRLYDYNRLGLDGKPRELHIQAALETVDFDGLIPSRTVPGLCIQKGQNRLTYAIANRYFAAIKYELADEPLTELSNPAAFSVFTCVMGSGQIGTPEMSVDIPVGRSVMVPAGLGAYELRGRCVLLKSFVPDVAEDFLQPLRLYGYTEAEIEDKTSQ